MSDKTVTIEKSGGIGVFGVLGIVFVLCKVFEVAPIAAWSWWWVLAPFWIPACVGLGILAIALLVALIVAFKS